MSDKLLTKENYKLLLDLQDAFSKKAIEINNNPAYHLSAEHKDTGIVFTEADVFVKRSRSRVPIEFIVGKSELDIFLLKRLSELEDKGIVFSDKFKANFLKHLEN